MTHTHPFQLIQFINMVRLTVYFAHLI